ncbi:hypothetical protein HNR07_001719 [Nocardiopsis metallicus]|uniref:VOC domain-containing protein n=2 Tax=Nocardiopsis metallicus TaxID=179819 RepID=A0A840W3D2_9ACTN|nr:hypothetical protein [Nocardiopsis metallicus]
MDDVHAGYERLRELGVRFTQGPLEMGPVTTAVLDDTCGNLIQIMDDGTYDEVLFRQASEEAGQDPCRQTPTRTRPRAQSHRAQTATRHPVTALLVGSASLLILLALGLHLLLDREAEPYPGWRITGFDTQITVHASGSVDTIETITYDFGSHPSHGLTRELPETGWIDGYGWRDFGLTSIRGEGHPTRPSSR